MISYIRVDETRLERMVPAHLVGGQPVEAHVFHRQGDAAVAPDTVIDAPARPTP